MPRVDTVVGPLPLPAPTDAPDAKFVDPSADSLLDYLAFWLKWGLDEKIATMTVPDVPNVVPTANRYTSPPSSLYLKRALPALFVYWTGKSTQVDLSTVKDLRARDFAVLYVYEKITNPEQLDRWSGLTSTIDAIVQKAISRRAHRLYGAPGSAQGSDVRFMFGWRGVHFVSGQDGFLKEFPARAMRQLADAAGKAGANSAQGGIQSGYPAWSGIIRIWEEIGADTFDAPADRLHDVPVSMGAGEGAGGAAPNVLEGALAAEDGSTEAGKEF